MFNYKNAPYVELKDYHAPAGIQSYFVPMNDGKKLRVCLWVSDDPKINYRGTILLQQGHNEFVEKYYEVIDELLKRNFAVLSFDWRGQGMSERLIIDQNKAFVEDFKDHDNDLSFILENILVPNFPKPIIGIGHSMGGCIMLSALYKHKKTFNSVVLSAPMLGFRNESLLMPLISLMRLMNMGQSYLIGSKPNMGKEISFSRNDVTSDRFRYQRTQRLVRKNPNLRLWGITGSWAYAAKTRLEKIRSEGWAEEIKENVMIMNSINDKVVDPIKTEIVSSRMTNSKIINFSSEHEILMEKDHHRNKFWKNFDEFIEVNINA
jgi:lysophospholipase|tara:strand:- start:3936 stop:4895 length:960 start_codon:yes stop_codon:yes gene_type:complete